MSVKYGLVRPCPKCPFRTDVEPYLRPGRVAEIATTVQSGSEFYCHQTTVAGEDEFTMAAGDKTQVCAGSLILMEKQETPNQSMRIAERLGAYDPDLLDMEAPVHDSWVAMQRHFAEEEGETCSVVGPYCLAPAGYMVGGAVVEGTEFIDTHCDGCGEPVCGECTCSCQEEW